VSSGIYSTQAQLWLTSLAETELFAGVFFEQPSEENPLASECTSGSYARCPLTFTFVASRTLANLQTLEWLNLEDTTIVGVGAFDAPFGGRLRTFHLLQDAVPISGRGSWQLGPEQLYVHV